MAKKTKKKTAQSTSIGALPRGVGFGRPDQTPVRSGGPVYKK